MKTYLILKTSPGRAGEATGAVEIKAKRFEVATCGALVFYGVNRAIFSVAPGYWAGCCDVDHMGEEINP